MAKKISKRKKRKKLRTKNMNNIKEIKIVTPKIFEQLKKYLQVFRSLMKTAYQYTLILKLVLGIISSRGTLLTNIARTKHFTKKQILNTVKSISRGINEGSKRIDLDKFQSCYLSHLPFKFAENLPIILVDLTDISKPRGKKFEYLDRVHDGSVKNKRIENGYWVLTIIGYDPRRNLYIPFVLEVYSLQAKDVLSQNEILFRKLKEVIKITNGKGIYIFDRVFDDKKIMNLLKDIKYIMAGKSNREIYVKEKTYRTEEYLEVLVKESKKGKIYEIAGKKDKKVLRFRLNIGFKKIKAKGVISPLNLVSSYDNIRNTMRYFYTNIEIKSKRQALEIVELYLMRWKIEEFIQFIKTHFGLEKFRIRKYASIKLLVFLIMIAFTFLSILWNQRDKRLGSLVLYLSQSLDNKITLQSYSKGIAMLFFILLILEELYDYKI